MGYGKILGQYWENIGNILGKYWESRGWYRKSTKIIHGVKSNHGLWQW